MNDKQHLNFNSNSLTISTLHNTNNMKTKSYYINYENKTKTYDVIDCTHHEEQPIVASFSYEANAIKHQSKLRRNETWKDHISNMSTEEIEKRSLLVSMSEQTDDNILFQQLLTNEYNNRKNIK